MGDAYGPHENALDDEKGVVAAGGGDENEKGKGVGAAGVGDEKGCVRN